MKLPRLPYNPDYYPNYAYRKVDLLLEEDSNSGEGVWLLVAPPDLIHYDDDKYTGESYGVLCNNSRNYPELKAGQVVPIKFNGEFRATIPLNWTKEFKYKK